MNLDFGDFFLEDFIIANLLKPDLDTVDSRYLESKGPSKTLRDIHTSTYQIYSIEEKNI